jgi:hypothetical protein
MTPEQALAKVETHQRESHQLAERYLHLSDVHLELERMTRGRAFEVRNQIAWTALLGEHRLLVVDCAEWLRSLLPLLRDSRDGRVTCKFNASRRRARQHAERAAKSQIGLEGDVPASLRRSIYVAYEPAYVEGGRAALRRLFGEAAHERGHATTGDFDVLKDSVEQKWGKLVPMRNAIAHAFSERPSSSTLLRLDELEEIVAYVIQLLADIRFFLDSIYDVQPPLTRQETSVAARDIVYLIVLGPIQFITGTAGSTAGSAYHAERENAYRRLHDNALPDDRELFNVFRETL